MSIFNQTISEMNVCIIIVVVISNIVYGYTWHIGHAVVQWLRYYATNRKVAGSIPDGVRIFH
jgi:hypothetical protein